MPQEKKTKKLIFLRKITTFNDFISVRTTPKDLI